MQMTSPRRWTRTLTLLHHSNHRSPQSELIREVYRSVDPELIVVGPAETGKTYSILDKLLNGAAKRKLRILILRKTLKQVYQNIIPDINKILKYELGHLKCAFRCRNGHEKPEYLVHKKTQSQIVFGGVDEVDNYLGGGYDIIFVSQAEALTEAEWETLTTRNTGRAGNWVDVEGVPMMQLIADCNPSHRYHWIPKRGEVPGKARIINTTLWDNASLFYNGRITPKGEKTKERLEASLTGARRKRLLDGEWFSEEGVVYKNWDPAIHEIVMERSMFNDPSFTWHGAIDYGGESPFAFGLWAIQNTQSRVHPNRYNLFKEIVVSDVTIDQVYDRIAALLNRYEIPKLETIVADTNVPGFTKALRQKKLNVLLADKDIAAGIDSVKQVIGDNRFFSNKTLLDARDPIWTKSQGWNEEVVGYCYHSLEKQEQMPSLADKPIKKNDHSCDEVRYRIYYSEKQKQQGRWKSGSAAVGKSAKIGGGTW